MDQPGQVERLWLPRLRWRMRGAWQWPAFAALTVLDGVLIAELPFYERGPGNLAGGLLLAGFVNLFAVAVLAPLAGRWVRRRRTDLPRLVANDYAGTAALAAVTLSFLTGGLLHRPAVAAERADVAAVVAGTHRYVLGQQARVPRRPPVDRRDADREGPVPQLRARAATRHAGCACSSTRSSARPGSRSTPTRRPTPRIACTAGSGDSRPRTAGTAGSGDPRPQSTRLSGRSSRSRMRARNSAASAP